MLFRIAVLLPCLVATSHDWPGFRGHNLSGTSAETGLPIRFDAGTNGGWSIEVPPGRSSPVITKNRIFLTAWDHDNLMVLGFDTRFGKKLWHYSIARSRRSEFDDRNNDPASPTSATDGEALYSFFPDFGLIALSVEGRELWKLPLGPFTSSYGMGSSPVVHGETVFLQCDQTRGSFLVAVHKRTGKVKWRVDRPEVIEGWSTPLILREREELIALGSTGVEAFDRNTGKRRWSFPAADGIMIPVPITDGKTLIATIRGSEQSVFPTWANILAALDRDKDGKLVAEELEKRYHRNDFGIADPDRDGYITEQEWNRFRNRGVGEFGITCIRLSDNSVVWRHKRGLPYVPSPVLYQGVLYSVRNGGIITSIDAGTGEVRKEGRAPDAAGLYIASPVAGDGKVYFAGAEGKITIVKAAAEWEVLAVNDLADGITATPAIADRALFVRTHKKLYCFRQP